jgi:phenylacetate-CoA ligase
MITAVLKKIYDKSPARLKKISGSLLKSVPAEVLYGKSFRQWRDFLAESQWWSRKEIEEYQIRQLTWIVEYAYNNVPYYKRVFDEEGIRPSHIQTFDDLKKLPFLTKEIINKNFEDLVSRAFPRYKMISCNTGGTSGRRLYFLEHEESPLIEWAFITTMWNRVGFHQSDTRITVGDIPVFRRGNKKFWEFDPLRREWKFSPFHLSNEHLPEYIEKIKEINCRYIHGFVSSLTVIARFILDNDITGLPRFDAVLAGSEPMYSWQKDLLERAFRTRIFRWYGQNEKVILAGACEKNETYHIFPEYGYTEAVHPDRTPLTAANEVGMLVGTGFYNRAMPFIRYKLDDWGQIQEGECACGRHHKFLNGLDAKRVVNMIVSKKGHFISTTAINIRKGILDNVERFQFLQERKGELVLKILKGKNYTQKDTHIIRDELDNQIGDSIDLKIVFVSEIPLTGGGKQKILEQKLDIDLYKQNNI